MKNMRVFARAVLLMIVSAIWATIGRAVSGPLSGTPPDQGAMVTAFLFLVAWPIIGLVLVGLFWKKTVYLCHPTNCFLLLAWALSLVVPYVVMKVF